MQKTDTSKPAIEKNANPAEMERLVRMKRMKLGMLTSQKASVAQLEKQAKSSWT